MKCQLTNIWPACNFVFESNRKTGLSWWNWGCCSRGGGGTKYSNIGCRVGLIQGVDSSGKAFGSGSCNGSIIFNCLPSNALGIVNLGSLNLPFSCQASTNLWKEFI